MKTRLAFLILVLTICVALIAETIYSALAGLVTNTVPTFLAFSGLIFIGFFSVMLMRVLVIKHKDVSCVNSICR